MGREGRVREGSGRERDRRAFQTQVLGMRDHRIEGTKKSEWRKRRANLANPVHDPLENIRRAMMEADSIILGRTRQSTFLGG